MPTTLTGASTVWTELGDGPLPGNSNSTHRFETLLI